MLSLLWGIENLGIEAILENFNDKKDEIEEITALFSWISNQIILAIENGTHSVPVTEIAEPLEMLLNNKLKKNKKEVS